MFSPQPSKCTNMKDNELKKIWKDASVDDRIQLNHQNILNNMTNANQKIDRQIKWRNIAEIGASIFVIFIFSRIAFNAKDGLVKFGAALVIPAAIFIIYKLISVQNKRKPNGIALSIKDQLIHRKNYLIKEKALLKNIFYWYILPLTIPMILISIGSSVFFIATFLYLCLVVGFSYFIFWLNQKAAKKFDPHIEQLEKAIQQLEQEK